MADGSRSEFSIEEHEQQHQSILSKMDLIIEMIRDLRDYIRTPTSPSENESEFPTVDLHLHGTIGDVQQVEEQQVEESMMQIEANLHTPVKVNEAAESNPIVVEEISILDVGRVANENAVNEGNKEDFSDEIDEGHLQFLQMEAEEGKVIDEMFHPNTGHYVFDNLPKSVPTARQSFSLVSLFRNERNNNSLLNKAVNPMLDEVGQPFWLKMHGIKADQQLFDKMTEPFPRDVIDEKEAFVLAFVEPQSVLSSGCEATVNGSINGSYKTRFDGVTMETKVVFGKNVVENETYYVFEEMSSQNSTAKVKAQGDRSVLNSLCSFKLDGDDEDTGSGVMGVREVRDSLFTDTDVRLYFDPGGIYVTCLSKGVIRPLNIKAHVTYVDVDDYIGWGRSVMVPGLYIILEEFKDSIHDVLSLCPEAEQNGTFYITFILSNSVVWAWLAGSSRKGKSLSNGGMNRNGKKYAIFDLIVDSNAHGDIFTKMELKTLFEEANYELLMKMFSFDPGGCSWSQIGCDPFEFDGKHGDNRLEINVDDELVQATEYGAKFFGEKLETNRLSLRHVSSLETSKHIENNLSSVVVLLSDRGSCVTYIKNGGHDYFVKMIRNMIEYGDVQLIEKDYHLKMDDNWSLHTCYLPLDDLHNFTQLGPRIIVALVNHPHNVSSICPKVDQCGICKIIFPLSNSNVYKPYVVISRFMMDVLGQGKKLTWLKSSNQWNLFWTQSRRQCSVYPYCDKNGGGCAFSCWIDFSYSAYTYCDKNGGGCAFSCWIDFSYSAYTFEGSGYFFFIRELLSLQTFSVGDGSGETINIRVFDPGGRSAHLKAWNGDVISYNIWEETFKHVRKSCTSLEETWEGVKNGRPLLVINVGQGQVIKSYCGISMDISKRVHKILGNMLSAPKGRTANSSRHGDFPILADDLKWTDLCCCQEPDPYILMQIVSVMENNKKIFLKEFKGFQEAIEWEHYVWNLGQNVLFHILEDKDVFERVGNDLIDEGLKGASTYYNAHLEFLACSLINQYLLLLLFVQTALQQLCLSFQQLSDSFVSSNINCCTQFEFTATWFVCLTNINCLQQNGYVQTTLFEFGCIAVTIVHKKLLRTFNLLHFWERRWDSRKALIFAVGTDMENFIWNPGIVCFRLTTLRARWLLRGRICHDIAFYYNYFRIYAFSGLMSFN